jgi:hypothetical protein
MAYFRKIRLMSAAVALLSLLFMQLAVAAYACPNLVRSERTVMLDSSGRPMADCPEADKQSPTLCHEHTYKSASSLDKADAPSVMPFLATGFALPLLWVENLAPARNVPSLVLHASGTSPPIAIRHCCFRL